MTASPRQHLEDLGPLFAPPAPPQPAPRARPPRYRKTEPYHGQAPVAPGSDMSAKAARRTEPTRLSKREIVYQFLVAAGAYDERTGKGGATRAEIRDTTGLIENTVNGRVAELVNLGRAKEARRADGRTAQRGDRAVIVADRYVPEWQRAEEATHG